MIFDIDDCAITIDLFGEGGAGRENAKVNVFHRPTSIEETREVIVDGTQEISQADAAKQEAIEAVKVQVEALP